MPVKDDVGEMAVRAPLSMRANFAWSLAGNVLYALCQWGVLVVLAKLCSTETVGVYLLGVTVTSPIFLFAGLQLRRLQATDVREEFSFGDYFGMQILACGVGMLAAWGFAVACGYRDAALAVILLVGLNKAFENLSNTFYGLFQQRERLDRISKSMVWHGVLTAVGLCAGIWLTGSIVIAAALSAVGRVLAIVAYDVPSLVWVGNDSLKLWPTWNWLAIKKLAWLGVPLGVTSMLVSLNTNLPRGFVEGFCSTAELGIFGVLCTPLAVMHTLTRALESSASARLARLFDAGDVSSFRRCFGQLMGTHTAIALAGVTAAYLVGKPVLAILFKPEYAAHTDVFITIMWATLAATSAGVMMTAMIAARFVQSQLPLNALTSALSLIACAWFVPTRGMQGAAIALVVSKLPYLAIGGWMLWTAENKLGDRAAQRSRLAPRGEPISPTFVGEVATAGELIVERASMSRPGLCAVSTSNPDSAHHAERDGYVGDIGRAA